MVGPNQERWERWLAEANEQHVGEAGTSWMHAQDILKEVQYRLERAAEQAYVMGGQTGPAMREAFSRSAVAMRRKADQVRDGGAALLDVAAVVARARQAHTELGPGTPAPAAPSAPTSGQPTRADLRAQSRYQSQVQAHQAQEAHREEVARAWTAHMDTTYTRSARTMQSIHGEPDPTPTPQGPQSPTSPALTPPPPGGQQPPASTPNGGGHPGGGAPPGGQAHPTGTQPTPPGQGPDPTTGADTPGTTTVAPAAPGTAQGGGPTPAGPAPTPVSAPGLTGSVGPAPVVAGLVGGGGLAAAVTGLRPSSGAPALSATLTPGRPVTLGGSTRPMNVTTIGQGTATSPGQQARSGSATGARTPGGGAGSRGASGTRAKNAGSGGRGSRNGAKKKARKPTDLAEDLWEVEDEDAGPTVLDNSGRKPR